MLVECCSLLVNIVLQDSISDTWVWKLDHVHGYSLKGVYNLLTSNEQEPQAPFTDIVWNKTVSLEVSIFTWQFLNKRLPTTNNLARRCVLSQGSLSCSGVCSQQESANHLFLECSYFQEVWLSVQQLLGISSVLPPDIGMHALQFCGAHNYRRDICCAFISFGWLVFGLFRRNIIFEFSKTNIHLLLKWLKWWNSILDGCLRCLDPMTLSIFMLGGLTFLFISVTPTCNDDGWVVNFLFLFAFLVVVLWRCWVSKDTSCTLLGLSNFCIF